MGEPRDGKRGGKLLRRSERLGNLAYLLGLPCLHRGLPSRVYLRGARAAVP